MLKFTLNKKSIQVKSSWEDLTYGDYLRTLHVKQGDTAEILSIITGLPVDQLRKATISGLEQLIVAAQFMHTIPNFSGAPSKVGPYQLPKDITLESLAQFEDMRSIMLKTGNNPTELLKSYGQYVGIYVQKLRDGEYDSEKAEAMLPEISEYKARQVVEAGSFFLIRLLSLINGTKASSPNHTVTPRASTGKRSVKRSARTRSSTRSPKR